MGEKTTKLDKIKKLAKSLNQKGRYLIETDTHALKAFECDGLTAFRQKPLAVMMPKNVAQLRQMVLWCRDHNVKITPRGAGTGLSAGATPTEDSVVLSLNGLNQILEINPKLGFARVQAGVVNGLLNQKLKPLKLQYAPDPSSQIACTLGGNIAENAGGLHCLKYGLTLNHILELTLMDGDGNCHTYGSESAGFLEPDLLSIIVGSEGLLGLVVEAKVRLCISAERVQTFLIGFKSYSFAAQAVARIIESGLLPSALEMMDERCLQLAQKHLKVGYPQDVQALLICELDGNADQVESEKAHLYQALQSVETHLIEEAKDDAHRERIWAGRKKALPLASYVKPDYMCMDGSIKRQNIAAALESFARLSKEYGLEVMNVFHAGDGNLHPLILFDESKGELEKAKELGGKILEACLEQGGSISGEHGVGLEKIDQMCSQFSRGELEAFHQLKQCFDTHQMFNPKKSIPTLHRCAEMGQMVVKGGKLPFAEIERF